MGQKLQWNISLDFIKQITSQFANSAEGQRYITAELQKIMEANSIGGIGDGGDGNGDGGGGGVGLAPGRVGITEARAKVLVSEMVSILYNHIRHDTKTQEGNGLRAFPRQAIVVQWSKPQGFLRVSIGFDTDYIHRDSLYTKKYDGINDIIALFTTGYSAHKYAYGKWTHWGFQVPVNHGKSIRSLKRRRPNPFLQNAVDEFNNKYGKEGRATVAPMYSITKRK